MSGYVMHIFSTVGDATLTCSVGGEAEILVVAVGGGGGASNQNYILRSIGGKNISSPWIYTQIDVL